MAAKQKTKREVDSEKIDKRANKPIKKKITKESVKPIEFEEDITTESSSSSDEDDDDFEPETAKVTKKSATTKTSSKPLKIAKKKSENLAQTADEIYQKPRRRKSEEAPKRRRIKRVNFDTTKDFKRDTIIKFEPFINCNSELTRELTEKDCDIDKIDSIIYHLDEQNFKKDQVRPINKYADYDMEKVIDALLEEEKNLIHERVEQSVQLPVNPFVEKLLGFELSNECLGATRPLVRSYHPDMLDESFANVPSFVLWQRPFKSLHIFLISAIMNNLAQLVSQKIEARKARIAWEKQQTIKIESRIGSIKKEITIENDANSEFTPFDDDHNEEFDEIFGTGDSLLCSMKHDRLM
ncbi:unnamed protein product [Caenorhabditis bovis]|uniref:Uncharacterized protein n=1 Tax=Caenorhabditis bovis TaxID=2654633 RepID=A0A8S1F7E9_9PELO|nr:unnamed protein product [Caenorhabditis bovis]